MVESEGIPVVGDGPFQWHIRDEVTYLAPARLVGQPQLCVAFTARYAGRSGRSLNMSIDRAGRHKALANRRRILRALGLEHPTLYAVRQVHGNAVCIVDSDALMRGLDSVCADALVTDLPGIPLGVLIADCLPVILYSPQPRVLAVVHAGRMGTYHRVVPAALDVMQTRFGVSSGQIHAILGPGIGDCCYRLDAQAVTPFQDRFRDWDAYFTPQEPGYWTMSLTRANQAQLQAAGVPLAQVQSAELCTVCHNTTLYSHRAEGQNAGRGMGIAALLV
ncbi:MAG TPA: polyphenol oxidase family protein [Candidatus Entotheonella sp.]